MGSYARIVPGQSAEAVRKALEAVALSGEQAQHVLIDQIREIVPFRHISISGLNIEAMTVGTGTFLLNDFPPEYLAEYYAGDYADLDPLMTQFRQGQSVCRDSEAFATTEARRNGHEVLDLLRRHGIPERTAIVIYHNGKAIGSLCLITDKALSERQCNLLQLVAMTVHAAFARPALGSLNHALKLTRGELYCLERAAGGLTSEDIAAEDVYSVDTVNTYLKTATRKLGAQNRVQAVAEAMRRGLIG
ncbi:hypothetical protein ABAC460_07160 [Asticcacaulis sp. AC460]|uniref:helix-turn-helix transcriptional regulator n=1 Tax=Asticcacaulis sp. AC460 TaxID=1282360 RepID=UPI0003C40DC8|nr:LuxR family transcriptional regulator [Asticcacaulis sp. AC460]ESQ91339.1 hypothetical protein ABAC460_07160 [Asticcacaulis sp. AC460]